MEKQHHGHASRDSAIPPRPEERGFPRSLMKNELRLFLLGIRVILSGAWSYLVDILKVFGLIYLVLYAVVTLFISPDRLAGMTIIGAAMPGFIAFVLIAARAIFRLVVRIGEEADLNQSRKKEQICLQ